MHVYRDLYITYMYIVHIHCTRSVRTAIDLQQCFDDVSDLLDFQDVSAVGLSGSITNKEPDYFLL